MQLEQTFELPAAPAQAWQAFKNIELLVECLPGAALTGPAVDGELPLRFDVKMGPISTNFLGAGRVTFDDATSSGRFEGAAADKRTGSRVKGVAAFSVEPQGGGSLVRVNVDYNLTGALAQFSRGGIVRELAAALTAQFAGNLSTRLQAAAPVVAEAPIASAVPSDDAVTASEPVAIIAAPVQAARPAAVPLNAGSLIGGLIKARWQRFLDRLLRRRPA
jgi:carbon monoxide dehydrogenase subunit G